MTNVTVDQDQAQGQIQAEIGLDVSGAENMITLSRTDQTWKQHTMVD